MNFINKKGIIIVLIAFIICMTVVGCSDNSEETPSEPVQEPEETASEPAQEPEEVVQYVDNETINSFLITFTEATGKEMTDIDNSSRKYKATAKYDGFWIVIEDLQEEFRIRIEQTSDTASVGMPGMKEAFFGIVKAMDDSINDEEIYSYFDSNIEEGIAGELGKLNINIRTDLELSSGRNPGYIEVSSPVE